MQKSYLEADRNTYNLAVSACERGLRGEQSGYIQRAKQLESALRDNVAKGPYDAKERLAHGRLVGDDDVHDSHEKHTERLMQTNLRLHDACQQNIAEWLISIDGTLIMYYDLITAEFDSVR